MGLLNIVGTVEKVEALYDGYGDNKELKGATVVAKFTKFDATFKVTVELPTGVGTYPTVGDSLTLNVDTDDSR